ncbi:MAG: hypothetical protein ABIO76_04685 [Ginsengibacter sp.]
MEDKLNNHKFLEFAEQRLEEHIAELNTHYEGRTMPDNDEKKTAFNKHFNMFTAELEEKTKELGIEETNKKTIEEYREKFRNSLQ